MSVPERWTGFRALPANIKQRLGRLIPLFEREGVRLAYLFGSLSRDETGHDVDLALLTTQKPVFQLRAAISDCLDTERLDLVDLNQAPPSLRFEIIRIGQPLYTADETICADFELSTLRLYKDRAWLRRRQASYLKERMARWSSDLSQSGND